MKSTYENLINLNYDAVPLDLCDKLIDYSNKMSDHFKDSMITSNPLPDKNIRNSKELVLAWDHELAQDLLSIVDPLIVKYLNNHPELFNMLGETYYENGHILKYMPGDGFYKFHYDTGGVSIDNRVLSIIVYLNDVVSGGETQFKYNTPTLVTPEKGKVLIFPSRWTHTHRGNVPIEGVKFICVLWLRKKI